MARLTTIGILKKKMSLLDGTVKFCRPFKLKKDLNRPLIDRSNFKKFDGEQDRKTNNERSYLRISIQPT